MKERIFKMWTIKGLQKIKKSIEFEIKNWERRIREQTEDYTELLRPVSEYKSRIKKCQKELDVVNEELELRGELTVINNDNNDDGGEKQNGY